MKILKWLAIALVTLVLVIGIGITALVYLVDWNQRRTGSRTTSRRTPDGTSTSRGT